MYRMAPDVVKRHHKYLVMYDSQGGPTMPYLFLENKSCPLFEANFSTFKSDKAMSGQVKVVQIMYDNRSLIPRSMLAVSWSSVCLGGCDVLTRG